MAKGKKRKAAPGDVATNRQASYRYHLLDKLEAGIVLTGHRGQVAARRQGAAQGRLRGGPATARCGCTTSTSRPTRPPRARTTSPSAPRKLLLHRREIERLIGKTREKGLTLVPTRIYFKGGRAKVEIALARGKDVGDKRQTIKEREIKREMERAVARATERRRARARLATPRGAGTRCTRSL